MPNMCSYEYVHQSNNNYTSFDSNKHNSSNNSRSKGENTPINNFINNDIFSINDDRLEVFGISINIDDLIILIMLFFMFRENQIDYSIIIILALILFDQS